MLALITLLGLAACSSAGSLDNLRSQQSNLYLPPSQPNNQYLPPSQPNSQYLPPSQRNSQYLPPSQPNNQYLPPSQPNNQYLPPSQPNNQYLPPSQPEKTYVPPTPAPTLNRAYVPPSQPQKPYVPPPPPATPNRAYIPPSAPEKLYLPPTQSISVYSQTPSTPNNLYLPPSNSYLSSSGITGAVFRQQLTATKPVAILKQVNENTGDGVYAFSYESEDGTTAEERGQLKAGAAEGIQSAQGAFAFTAPDNVRYTVTYTADENGFQPQGAHLPTSPPIPEAILKSLADNAADEAHGIVDDGSYREESSNSGYQYQRGSAASQQTSGGYQTTSISQSGYQGSRSSSFAQDGYQGSSSFAQSGYQRDRPANGGYSKDSPSPAFNF